MENQEKVAEEQKNPSSIDKYLIKLRKELEVGRESGDNERAYFVVVCETDGTKNEEGLDGVDCSGLAGGGMILLSEAMYHFMEQDKDLEKVISRAAGKNAFNKLLGKHGQ